jgi:hypothetical protein
MVIHHYIQGIFCIIRNNPIQTHRMRDTNCTSRGISEYGYGYGSITWGLTETRSSIWKQKRHNQPLIDRVIYMQLQIVSEEGIRNFENPECEDRQAGHRYTRETQ